MKIYVVFKDEYKCWGWKRQFILATTNELEAYKVAINKFYRVVETQLKEEKAND